ncbi:MAG: alpha/beta hydrolase [Chthoniobacteraceae bacterium]
MTLSTSTNRLGSRKLSTLHFSWKIWLLFLFLAPVAFAEPDYPPIINGAKIEKYKTIGDVTLNLWIFNPKNHQASDKKAAIVFFFGGGWNKGSPLQFEQHCKLLAERGMVAITADYRVNSRNNVKPVQCVADARSALRWVRANAAKLGIDSQRIAAGGGSAGGHLAAATAFITEFDEPGEDKSVSAVPNALVLFNPALVLAPLEGYDFPSGSDRVSEERLGIKPEKISPVHHVAKGAPPIIIFHGKADTTVAYSSAEAFTTVMKKVGARCELIGYEGAVHSFYTGRQQYAEDTKTRMTEFLKSLGYLGK